MATQFLGIDSRPGSPRAQELAEDLGVPHPITYSFADEGEFLARVGSLPSRGVIKHVDSHGSHGISFYQGEGSEWICHRDGEVRNGLIEDILASGIDVNKLIFETLRLRIRHDTFKL